MIYTDLTKKALKISFNAHKDQLDKSGMPYVYHPFHLAEQMDDEYSTCVALLHDVVEDSDMTLEDLKKEGFPDEVTDAIALMTHDDSVPYFEYIMTIKTNPVAAKVKAADLRHNSDLSRLDTVDAKAIERFRKYNTSICLLLEQVSPSDIRSAVGKIVPCCKVTVPAEYLFCPHCGQRITDAKKTETEFDTSVTGQFCKECGRLCPLLDKYCGYCGTKL